jgi:hypothetical protein
MLIVPVKAQFIHHKKQNDQGTGDPNGQSKQVYQGITLVPPGIAEGNQ